MREVEARMKHVGSRPVRAEGYMSWGVSVKRESLYQAVGQDLESDIYIGTAIAKDGNVHVTYNAVDGYCSFWKKVWVAA